MRRSGLVEDDRPPAVDPVAEGGKPERGGGRQARELRSVDLGARVVKWALALFFGVLFVVPLVWLLSSALKTNGQEFSLPPSWLPHPFDFANFRGVFSFVPFGRFYLNTVVIAGATVVGSICSNVLVAYGFSRIQWAGREVLFGVALATLMIPYLVILVPQYVLFYHFGWINTYLPLILPAFGGNPFYIYMLRQFFRTIPEELSEAARVDGARELRILVSVIIPQIRAPIATVGLFSFLAAWNDFIGPLIYLSSERRYTLALGLNLFVSQYSHNWAYLMAAVLLTVLPVVILFVLFQRSFLRGIRMSGLMRV